MAVVNTLASPPAHVNADASTSKRAFPPTPSELLDTTDANGPTAAAPRPNPPNPMNPPAPLPPPANAVAVAYSSLPTKPSTTAPTTAVSRQSPAPLSAPASVAAHMGEPADLLRQTLQTAPNSRPTSRSSSRRRNFAGSDVATTPHMNPSIYTPNGSADNSEADDAPDVEMYRMRHGFEDEYNSEDYLAVLEQVCPHPPLAAQPAADRTGLLHVLHRQAPRDGREPQA